MKRRHAVRVLCFVLALTGLSSAAVGVPVYYAAEVALVQQVLDEMELDYVVTLDEAADPVWTFTHSGILITMVTYDETTAGSYVALLFYAGWAAGSEISLSAINDWNRRSRFGRAYVDETGDPAIELDLLLLGGVTAQTIREYIEVFVASVSDLGVALQL